MQRDAHTHFSSHSSKRLPWHESYWRDHPANPESHVKPVPIASPSVAYVHKLEPGQCFCFEQRRQLFRTICTPPIVCVSYMSTVPISYMSTVPIEAHHNWSMGLYNKQHPLLELPLGLRALYRWTLGGGRHRYATGWPNQLEIDPVAVDGIDGRRRESGKNPVSKHLIQPEKQPQPVS